MSNLQYQVQVLKARFVTHERETESFKWEFQSASDEQVLDTTPVQQDTIDGLSNMIIKIIVPRQRKYLRTQIAYLIGLKAKQAEVWARYLEDCQNRTNNTNQWVRQNAQ